MGGSVTGVENVYCILANSWEADPESVAGDKINIWEGSDWSLSLSLLGLLSLEEVCVCSRRITTTRPQQVLWDEILRKLACGIWVGGVGPFAYSSKYGSTPLA